MAEEVYEDLMGAMAEKLEAEEFSLARSSALLGMEGLTREDAAAMVREGDIDGDGALDEREFCVLMVRLSPGMMRDAEAWLARAIASELCEKPTSSSSS
ncbi:unnamed protein product [Spirodela intermedia]|uniref:EF-hand domain-containing protein n=1 Tax=Spirodela intermedia TaxID=51605 RepID=A0A7I8IG26_SPIIN|nr:unnamed protein product [Spirodela intermedia]CAA6656345.1 unnamed protein product [Spirodela intermedia]